MITVTNNSGSRIGVMFRPKPGQIRATRVVFPPGVSEIEDEKLRECLEKKSFQEQVEQGVIAFSGSRGPSGKRKDKKTTSPPAESRAPDEEAIEELGVIE